jgi:hypothetical protein
LARRRPLAATSDQFDPGMIMADTLFYDANAMTTVLMYRYWVYGDGQRGFHVKSASRSNDTSLAVRLDAGIKP